MIYQLVFGTAFTKAIKKLKNNTDLLIDLQQTLILLQENPYNPKLKTHKLKGILDGLMASSVNYNYRIIFKFVVQNDTNIILLVDFGTHDEVY